MKFSTLDITEPKNGLVVYKDSYWICENGNPQKALFYGRSPQCNNNKSVGEHFMKNGLYKDFNVSIVFVPIAFVPPIDY